MSNIALLFGVWRILDALRKFKQALSPREPLVLAPRFQAVVWCCLMAATVVAYWFRHEVVAIMTFVVGVLLPVTQREKRLKGTEGWPDESRAEKTSPQLLQRRTTTFDSQIHVRQSSRHL